MVTVSGPQSRRVQTTAGAIQMGYRATWVETGRKVSYCEAGSCQLLLYFVASKHFQIKEKHAFTKQEQCEHAVPAIDSDEPLVGGAMSLFIV